MSRNTSMFQAIHPGCTPRPSSVTIAVPQQLTGMGTLLGLEVGELADPNRVEEWCFSGALPRLAFEHVSPDASSTRRVSRLWAVGGAWHIDAKGQFRAGKGRSRATVRRMAHPRGEAARRYEETHGGLRGTEVVTGDVMPQGAIIPVRWCRAVIYHADKAERADRDPADYRHPFQEHARPLLCVDEAGTSLIFLSDKDLGAVSYASEDGRHTFSARRFGRYTVTPHGVEDIG